MVLHILGLMPFKTNLKISAVICRWKKTIIIYTEKHGNRAMWKNTKWQNFISFFKTTTNHFMNL